MKALNIPKVSSVPALRFVLFFIFSATVKAEELNTYGESPLSDFFEIRNHIQIEDEKLNMLHVNQKEIVDQIMSLKISQMLTGYRGSEVANINNIVQFIKTLLLLMDDTELKIEEIEVNPLFVYENQVKAIDAVIAVGN